MGADNSTSNTPFGLVPWGPVLRANYYAIVTSNAVAMRIGDMVESVGAGVSTPMFGVLQKCITEETGAAGTIIGAVIGLMDHTGFPVTTIPVTTVGNGTIAGYALVADHPDQTFLAKEDGDTSSIVLNDIGLNADMISTETPIAGNNYASTMEIDSSSVAVTATLALKILGVHPDDTVDTTNTAGRHSRFIVKINASYSGDITGA